MKCALLFLALIMAANAQAPADKPSPSSDTTVVKKDDPRLHQDTLTLVELSGVKQSLQASLGDSLEQGATAMMKECHACTPEFAAEWKKRMRQRVNLQAFLDVYVSVYEKYFNDEEIVELIALHQSRQTSSTVSPSPALKQKIGSVMPDVLAESIGGCARIGAKLGAEIGEEIRREHPEYVKAPAKP